MNNQKSKFSPLEFVYLDADTNKTVILEGRIIPNHPSNNNSRIIPPITTPLTTGGSTAAIQQVNAMGPMLYVLSVIIVYGLSMFLLVGTLARRKSYHKQLDVEVGRYIKGLRAARDEAKKIEVQRLRLNWPGNFIMFQQNSNTDGREKSGDTTDSDVECYPAISKPLEMTSSDESSYIELPATTVTLVKETNEYTNDISGAQIETNNEEMAMTEHDLTSTEKKGVRFDESHLERRENGHSQFLLREAICLSSENLNEILINKHTSTEEHAKHQNVSPSSNVNDENTNCLLHKDIPKQGSIDVASNINEALLSDNNPNEETVQSYDIQKIKKTKKRRRTEQSRELSSTEDVENDPVMEEYHKSAAFRQRNRRRNSQLNDTLKATSLNRLSPHLGDKETPLAAVHFLGLPKSDMDMDSASDDPCFEEYRMSKLYRSRYRGKRRGLLEPMERRISSSSAEGSPLLPQTRKIQQRYSTPERPDLSNLPSTKQLSNPLVAIKVTSPDNVELSDVDGKR